MTKPLPLEAIVSNAVAAIKAPKTTQDAVDTVASELAVAQLLRSHAERRYEAVKKLIIEAYGNEIAAVREEASDLMTKSSDTVKGVDWTIVLSANRPAARVDVDELRTELVRRGISVDIIDSAIKAVTKLSTPALTLAATPKE